MSLGGRVGGRGGGGLTCMYGHAHSYCREGEGADIGDTVQKSEGVQIWELRHEELEEAESDDAVGELVRVSFRVVGLIQSLCQTRTRTSAKNSHESMNATNQAMISPRKTWKHASCLWSSMHLDAKLVRAILTTMEAE